MLSQAVSLMKEKGITQKPAVLLQLPQMTGFV